MFTNFACGVQFGPFFNAIESLPYYSHGDSRELDSFKDLLATRSAEYVEQILQPHFGTLVKFVQTIHFNRLFYDCKLEHSRMFRLWSWAIRYCSNLYTGRCIRSDPRFC